MMISQARTGSSMIRVPNEKPQVDKFRDMARELECDEDEAAFEDKVRKVATVPSTASKATDSE